MTEEEKGKIIASSDDSLKEYDANKTDKAKDILQGEDETSQTDLLRQKEQPKDETRDQMNEEYVSEDRKTGET